MPGEEARRHRQHAAGLRVTRFLRGSASHARSARVYLLEPAQEEPNMTCLSPSITRKTAVSAFLLAALAGCGEPSSMTGSATNQASSTGVGGSGGGGGAPDACALLSAKIQAAL